MRLDWIEDIVAVLDAGSISAGAARRNLSQPAFSRRLRTAEEALGVTLFDRRARPAQPMPWLAEIAPRLRATAAEIRQLRVELRLAASRDAGGLVLASQHSLTTMLAAGLVERLDDSEAKSGPEAKDGPEARPGVRLRSANRDDCVIMLVTGVAEIALMHRRPGETVFERPSEIELVDFARDSFCPVATEAEAARLGTGEMRMIAYPGDVYLGRVFAEAIAPHLPEDLRLRARAETALTPAALQFAIEGAGVAWLPMSIAQPALTGGQLCDLSNRLPAAELRICAARRRGRPSPAALRAWELILSRA